MTADRALRDALESCTTTRAACDVACAHLAATDDVLATAYIERGGRLRLQAAHGYWQAIDGLPPFAGVIGATGSSARSRPA